MKQQFLNSIHNSLKVLLLGVICCLATSCSHAQNKSTFTADDHTIMLLKPGTDGTLIDAKSTFTPTVKGAATIDDPEMGKVLRFGDAAGNGIRVADSGKIDFSHGMTLEAWIKLDETEGEKTNHDGAMFVKMGSFWYGLKNNKLSISWMVFPTVPVATSTDKQYKSYPVGGTGFPGRLPIPMNKWVHIAATYDPVTRAARVWIDGKLDAWMYQPRRYFLPDQTLPLENDPKSSLDFLRGMENVQVAEIRVSDLARAITPLPPFNASAMALPYRGKSAVNFTNIDPRFLPVNVTLQGNGKDIQKLTIISTGQKVVQFAPPVKSGQYALTIKATSNGKEVYSNTLDIYAGDDTKNPFRIDEQNRFIVEGKPFFPLMIYHSYIQDIPQLAKIGFNVLSGARYPNSALLGLPTRTPETIDAYKKYLDAAKANNMYLAGTGGIFAAGGGSTKINKLGINELDKHPALAFWYGADEPGRARLVQLQKGYTAVKQINSKPVVVLTNRNDHLNDVAQAGDIVGVDPYPLPNISLRSVAVTTRHAVDASAGLKPVLTVIPQYDWQLPTEQELRCMAYLAIASGANGLGIYAWDDRHAVDSKTGKYKKGDGWYTAEHPKDLKILETVVGELSKMQDILLIPNSKNPLTFTPKNLALHAALKQGSDGTYLMLVNDSRAAEESTLSIAGIASADGAGISNTSGNIVIRDGKLQVKLPPLGTVLYKLSNVKGGG